MISVKIQNNKGFMKSLLTTDLFDNFYVEEVAIDTFNSFYIDGHIHKDFYADESEDKINRIIIEKDKLPIISSNDKLL